MSFPIPRPRGKDMPSAKPLRKTTNTRSNSAFGSVKTLDARGRHTVPFVSPPHFRTGSVPPPPQDPVERAALVALNHARNDRSQPKSRKVAP